MRNWNRKTSSSKLSSVSISFSTAAKGNFNHNRRTNSKVPENVDPTRTAFNKILIDKDIRQVYKEVFGEALAEYNANQVAKKHPERQKKDYYSAVCHDKKTEPFREAVVQIGNKDKQLPRWESNETFKTRHLTVFPIIPGLVAPLNPNFVFRLPSHAFWS